MSEALSLFKKAAQTAKLEDSKERFESENKTFQKSKLFYMDKDGEYNLHVLPTKPDSQGVVERDWEFPVHTFTLGIKIPNQNDSFYMDVVRPDYGGIDGDILATYDRLAKAEAAKNNDEALLKRMAHWKESLKYSYVHPCYVVDLDDNDEEIKIFKATNGQFKDIQKSRFTVWEGLKNKAERKAVKHYEKLAKAGKLDEIDNMTQSEYVEHETSQIFCPLTNPMGAYPLKITKGKEGGKTVYDCTVDAFADEMELSEKTAKDLMSLETIKEKFYSYNRYQFEATLVFLHQKDADWGLNVTQHPEFVEVVSKVEAQLSGDDNSFKIKDKNENELTLPQLIGDATGGKILLEDLCLDLEDLHDLVDDGEIKEDGEEFADLRNRMAQFITQEELNVTITMDMSNDDILDAIEEELKNPTPVKEEKEEEKVEEPVEAEKEEVEEEVEKPTRRRRRRTATK